MDLSRIESLTREMLEAEARRRGIKSPEFRTRTELVRLIVRHQYGGQIEASREKLEQGVRTVQIAKDLMSTAVSAAIGAIPARFDVLGLWSGKRTLPREHEPPESWTPSVERSAAQRPSARASSRPAPAVAEATTVPEVEPRASFAPLSMTPQTGQAARRPTTQPPPAEAPAPPPVAAADEHVAARKATTRTFAEEPIRTRSMAQLLASQGHRERALAIYEELLANDSSDVALEREALSLRRGEPVADVALPVPSREARPSQAPSGVWSSSREQLTCEGEPNSGLLLRWTITHEGERRARAVLGVDDGDGELTVRLVSIRPDADRIVRSEITEHGPVAASGEWSPGPLLDAERCVAAIGMRSGDRFVSIVHVQPSSVAAAAQA
jgi:hypothetical protein